MTKIGRNCMRIGSKIGDDQRTLLTEQMQKTKEERQNFKRWDEKQLPKSKYFQGETFGFIRFRVTPLEVVSSKPPKLQYVPYRVD